jgi:phosphatidylinositol 3-kinase
MISDISVSDSATCPIVLPYKNKNNEINSLLLKHDDVYKDFVVLNCIQLIDTILKKELGVDFGIITYKVIPFNNDGIIQMVKKSHTMYSIKEKLQFTIQNFIIEKNKNETIDAIRTRFMKSCCAYCVITYLFGIGDRHYENIMITEEGKLFHIDYGYILGSDPKPITPEMKITPEMIDSMGGQHSSYYQDFKKYCNDIFNVLRKHTNLFIHMFSVLNNDNTKITEQIIQRFMPGQEERHATLQLYSNMEKSVRSVNIEDFLRYHSKNQTLSKIFRFWK